MRVPRPIFSDVPEPRRRVMAAIRGQDTGPEIAVRRMLHAMGYRYRLHRRDLPEGIASVVS
jgi:DNA mismatch endonuclease, patch repair protein